MIGVMTLKLGAAFGKQGQIIAIYCNMNSEGVYLLTVLIDGFPL